MKVFGLTGGIASGKSTVARLLRARGVPVIDADEAAREVVEPGTAGLDEVVDAFGQGVLRPDGTLDRDALGRIIFQDPAARQRLNAIVHPKVQARMAEKVMKEAAGGAPFAFMDIPLLYEVRDPASFAGIVVVYVDPETQRERLMHRNGFTQEEAEARIASQLSLDEKARRATWVIDNRRTEADTEVQLDLLLARLNAEAQADHGAFRHVAETEGRRPTEAEAERRERQRRKVDARRRRRPSAASGGDARSTPDGGGGRAPRAAETVSS